MRPHLILGLPCINGVWLLVIVRLLPSLLIAFIDLSFIYMILLVVLGLARGIFVQGLGLMSNMASVHSNFHRGPLLWWNIGMAKESNLSVAASVREQRTRRNEGSSLAESFESMILPSGPMAGLEEEENHGSSVFGSVFKREDELTYDAARQSLRTMMTDLSDERVAMWDSFAVAWDEIVEDLRGSDLISNRERDNLKFIRLGYSIQGIRPILLPSFWTAGQLQRIVDGGSVSTVQQSLVLSEVRCLFVFLGCQLGLLSTSFAQALMHVTFLPASRDPHHNQSRAKMIQSSIKLMEALVAISECKAELPDDLTRRHSMHKDALVALRILLDCLVDECMNAYICI